MNTIYQSVKHVSKCPCVVVGVCTERVGGGEILLDMWCTSFFCVNLVGIPEIDIARIQILWNCDEINWYCHCSGAFILIYDYQNFKFVRNFSFRVLMSLCVHVHACVTTVGHVNCV